MKNTYLPPSREGRLRRQYNRHMDRMGKFQILLNMEVQQWPNGKVPRKVKRDLYRSVKGKGR